MLSAQANPLWSILLAGGEGERPFIEQWLGGHQPKQYCTFVGTRSILQHTMDRADRLVRSEQKVTVIGRDHRRFLNEAIEGNSSGHVIVQPHNCGTAAGVFLPLTFVRAWDADATVVIFPSDHFVFPEARFYRDGQARDSRKSFSPRSFDPFWRFSFTSRIGLWVDQPGGSPGLEQWIVYSPSWFLS